jgi:hypothetical protein
MVNKRVSNIVLALENQNKKSLSYNVDKALTVKLLESIENKRREIGGKLFECVSNVQEDGKVGKDWIDHYESYEPKVQEAIDYVVERVVNEDLELENTILMAAKQYNVQEEKLQEYFEFFTEVETKEVVSTSSDDGDKKRGMRDDEDTNKRVRYESFLGDWKTKGGVVVFENNTRYEVTPEQGNALYETFQHLNEENQGKMVGAIVKNRASFLNILDFSLRMVKG